MKIIVNPHKLEIAKEPVNEREIDITKCEFEFDDEITNDYVKEAYFTFEGTTYKQIIVNNECSIPYEVLEKKGQVEIGVVAFKTEGAEEIKRYNPSPAYFNTWTGSLKDNAENTEPITPSDKEQMEQALQNGLNDIAEAVENAGKLDIDVEKVGKVATITITKQDGTEKQEQIEDGEDGVSLQYNWSGTSLGIKREDEQNYDYVNLKGDKGDAGAIKMIIVNELPQTGVDDTIYLVPLENPDVQGNNYAEYVYINGAWELLGKIGVQVDLTDYYTKTETNDLLANKVGFTDYATKTTGGVIKASDYFEVEMNNVGEIKGITRTYSHYTSTMPNNAFISKGTLENVIAGKDLTTKTYVDGLVGDIGTILDSINNEVL